MSYQLHEFSWRFGHSPTVDGQSGELAEPEPMIAFGPQSQALAAALRQALEDDLQREPKTE